MCETLKKELKGQFLPLNTTWMAQESLKSLKQTNTIRDYVKELNSLILDITDMLKVDKLFNSMFEIQGWAQTEFRCQQMYDLPATMVAIDCLVNYLLDASSFASHKGNEEQQQRQSKDRESKDSKNNGDNKGNKVQMALTKVAKKSTTRQTTKVVVVLFAMVCIRPKIVPRMRNIDPW